MRTWVVPFALVLLLAACGSGADHSDDMAPVDTAGLHAAAIDYALSQGQSRGKELVYVTGPSTGLWDQWCGAGFAQGIDEACDVLDSIAFDLPSVFEGDKAEEITDALAPAAVEFVENRDELFEPMREGMMVAPVVNDGGLMSFGVSIEADGKVYLPLDGLGEGWIFEATPTDEGWTIEAVASWIA